jgi:hypothetical protein
LAVSASSTRASAAGAAVLVGILLIASVFRRAPQTAPAVGQTAGGMAKPADLACRELVDLVTDYLDGVLPPGWRAGFESHLADCDGCSEHVKQIRLTIRALEGLTAADSPPPVAGTTDRTSE